MQTVPANIPPYIPYQPPKRSKVVLICVMIFGAMLLMGAIISIGVFVFINNSDSMQTARRYIEAHPRIAELVGEVEGYGLFSPGSISMSGGGHGNADFTIRVNGTYGTVRVNIRLVKEPLRDWEVVYFFYRW